MAEARHDSLAILHSLTDHRRALYLDRAGEVVTVGWPRGISPLGSHRSVRNSLPLHGSCRSGHLTAGFAQAQCAKYRGFRATASRIAQPAFFQVRSLLYLFMIHRNR